MAYLRDVTIASKDMEVGDSRKLLKETKQRQAQLGMFYTFFSYSEVPMCSILNDPPTHIFHCVN